MIISATRPDDTGTRKRLQSGLQDEMSMVRLAAAQTLWELNQNPKEVLPTFAALLKSKLASVRTATLISIAEMGQAAHFIQSEIEPLMNDTKTSVRESAALALERIKSIAPTSTPNPNPGQDQ